MFDYKFFIFFWLDPSSYFLFLKMKIFKCPFGLGTGCPINVMRRTNNDVWCCATWEIRVSNIMLWVIIKSILDSSFLRISLVCRFWFLISRFVFVWASIKYSIRFLRLDFLGPLALFWNLKGPIVWWGKLVPHRGDFSYSKNQDDISIPDYRYLNMNYLCDYC